jgi:hypothetical protein
MSPGIIARVTGDMGNFERGGGKSFDEQMLDTQR